MAIFLLFRVYLFNLMFAGLEYAVNLENLWLWGNQIADVSSLADLTSLRNLDLSNNQVNDITPLANLVNLERLLLWLNQIDDIRSLANLINLVSLDLVNNQIEDIAVLANLTKLQSLNLGNNQINEITALAGLSSLNQLNLDRNQVSDITAVSNLNNLKNISLQGNGIVDISALAALTSLRWLHLAQNNIQDITALTNLSNLEWLYLNENQIADIVALAVLNNLRGLSLDGNNINNIIPLTNLTKLQSLYLRYNQITDLAPLVININNRGLGSGDYVWLGYNYLDLAAGSTAMEGIQTLLDRGVKILDYFPQRQRVEQPEMPVDFTDLNLEIAVRKALDKDSGVITRGDLGGMARLTADGLGITDLTGLEYAVNLWWLKLDYNKITDLASLAGLINLQFLYLDSNLINDISPLAGLQHLQNLYISENHLDKGELGRIVQWFPGLQELSFKGYGVSDLSILASLPKMRILNLAENDITDISALANMTRLEWLWLRGNQVADISALAGLTFLQCLILDNNQISDIAALSNMTNLIWLRLEDNHISDISALAGLTVLRNLDLSSNQINNLTSLDGLTNLRSLYLGRNHLGASNLAEIVQWFPQLQRLGFEGNGVSDISPLANLTNLDELRLQDNQIADLSPLITNSDNGGLGVGDTIDVRYNYLNLTAGSSALAGIQALLNNGVKVDYQPQRMLTPAQASVAIDNITNARPQAGLDQADIVYETAVALGITRYLAVFNLAKPVDKIGPVRSAREHLVGLAAGHGGGFAHAGGDSFSLAVLPKVPVVNLDEIYGAGSYFYRTTDRAMPHNLYTNASLLQQGLTASGQPLVDPVDPIHRGEMIGGDVATAAAARFPGQGRDTVFQWNATGQYYRRIVNGQPDLLENNAPITAANVIVLYTDHRQEYQANLNEWTIKARVEGKGDALFYRDGKVWAGQWNRTSRDAMFVFTVDGSPMQFAPGSVWVLITTIPGQQTVTIPDPGLDAALRAALEKPQWDLTTTDLAGLTYLDASGQGIQDLTGLDLVVNLQYLDLNDNDLSDISYLLTTGFGSGITIDLSSNYLDLEPDSWAMTTIQALGANGVTIQYQPQLGGVSGRLQLQARAEHSGLMTTLDIPGGGAGGGGGPKPPIPPKPPILPIPPITAKHAKPATPPVVSIIQPIRMAVTLYSNAAGGPAYTTIADAEGYFNLPRVEAGSYTLVVTQRKRLAVTRQVTVGAAQTTEVGVLQLVAGDLDGDHQIGAQDLRQLARAYGRKASGEDWNNFDINGDGRVNLYDTVLLARNYNKSSLPEAGVDSNLAQALAAGRLRSIGIIEGDLDGKLRPGATVTRAEFTVIVAILAGLKDEVAQYKQAGSPFSDVANNDWYSYWIKAAAAHWIIKGYPDGTFRPGEKLNNAEVITLLLRLLGYNDNLPGDWPVDYTIKAAALGLTANLALENNALAKRADVFVVVNNLLDLQKVSYDQATGNFIAAGERLVEELLGM